MRDPFLGDFQGIAISPMVKKLLTLPRTLVDKKERFAELPPIS